MSFTEEIKVQEKKESKLFRQGFAKPTNGQHLDGPRWSRRNKLLPSGESMKGKTSKMRKKYRRIGNTKTLVASK